METGRGTVVHDRGEEAGTGDRDCKEAVFLKTAGRPTAARCVPCKSPKD